MQSFGAGDWTKSWPQRCWATALILSYIPEPMGFCLFFCFLMYMCVLPAYMLGHHLHAWYPWRSEEGVGPSETGAYSYELLVVALSHWVISPVLGWIFNNRTRESLCRHFSGHIILCCFLKIIFIYVQHVCMCCCLSYVHHMHAVAQARSTYWCPGTRVAASLWAAWCRCWELNLGPLQELQVLLTAEPSLQSITCSTVTKWFLWILFRLSMLRSKLSVV